MITHRICDEQSPPYFPDQILIICANQDLTIFSKCLMDPHYKTQCPITDERENQVIPIVASLAAFLIPYTVSSRTVMLPEIRTTFGFDTLMLGGITSA